jgi:hypothetical protein
MAGSVGGCRLTGKPLSDTKSGRLPASFLSRRIGMKQFERFLIVLMCILLFFSGIIFGVKLTQALYESGTIKIEVKG